ncbi:MAG: penicillin-binding protein 2, partial [Patescibacteria group bacterium]
FALVSNSKSYLVFASTPDLKEPTEEIIARLSPILSEADLSSDSAEIKIEKMKDLLEVRLGRDDLVWVPLKHRVDYKIKKEIEALGIEGIGFENEEARSYPEASSSAHLVGFVGKDIDGRDKGYFGLEGFYDLELKGKPGVARREKDSFGRPILIGESKETEAQDGRTLATNIDRVAQAIVDKNLKSAIERYGASSGWVILMEPYSGAILAMSSYPSYDPKTYFNFNDFLFPNPAVSYFFEPGSIFKIAVMAAAINEGVVTPEMKCDNCSGPRIIDGYKIRTWDEKYYPNSTMTEVLVHSDNIGMIFIAEKLGLTKMLEYLKSFGLGEKTGIDLEEEAVPALREKKDWSAVDLAASSFGQGIALTPIQMTRIAAAIANGGDLVNPLVVSEVRTKDKIMEVKPEKSEKIFSKKTALTVTEMMIKAVDDGEAKWAKPEGYRIAGKTGTAQIPVAGHYDEEKTIASFVGFAPADDPRFVMLVSLKEPASSPWGSETAAPLWFDICRQLFSYWGISPE